MNNVNFHGNQPLALLSTVAKNICRFLCATKGFALFVRLAFVFFLIKKEQL